MLTNIQKFQKSWQFFNIKKILIKQSAKSNEFYPFFHGGCFTPFNFDANFSYCLQLLKIICLEVWFRLLLLWRYLCFNVWHRLWRLSPFRSDIVQMFTFLLLGGVVS